MTGTNSDDTTADIVHVYARVSTAEQAASGLGLEAQETACKQWARYAKPGAAIVVHHENGTSGTVDPDKRPVLGALLDTLDRDGGTLVVAKLDRASRSVVDLLRLVQRSEQHGWAFTALDLGIDSTSAAGRLVLSVLGSVAEWERNVIAERTSAALAAKAARGDRLGRPVSAATAAAAKQAAEMRAGGDTYQAIADKLNARGLRTAGGHAWAAGTVRRAVASHQLTARQAARRAQHEQHQQEQTP